MFQTEVILEGARTIRSYLPELVGAEAETIDSQLASLLARSEKEEKTDNLILDLLAQHKATKKWMRDYLNAASPTARLDVLRAYSRPGGDPSPIPAQRYVCPVDANVVWFKQFEGEEILICKDHGCQLVPAPPM